MPEKSLFAKNEEEVLNFWDEKQIFKKTLAKKSPQGNFIFFEGPPTANGQPGIHHVLARAFKDIILRFRTMQGYHIERKAGWDTHGLPVELQVEKQLNISGKPEIEKYGVEAFNQKCRESVWRYKDNWEKLTKRIAFWLDLNNPYITYTNDYIESLWWICREIHKKKLLYKGYKVVPQCPRCGTTLSSHEVAQGYKNVEENSIFIKFKIKNQENTYILSWTTTPWTLPGNIALAVGKHIEYAKVKHKNEYYILAKDSLKPIFGDEYEIVEEMRGKDLAGWEYEPLFPDYLDPGEKRAWFVGLADFVSTTDGTGVVHTAVMYGVDDFNFGEENDLPFVHTIDENGRFLPSVKLWAGKFVKDPAVEKSIIEDLKKRNLLYREKIYAHDYPFCWRCDSPLLYYAKDSWFFKVSSVQKKLIENNKKGINWIPEHIKEGRFGEWLAGIKDWAISRQRYWGTPIPIWICDKCNRLEVIGDFKELEAKIGRLPKNKNGELDVHRPFIDELTYSCACGGILKRIPDVFDCWFDSGSMPFAQHHYPFENKKLIDDKIQFPADYISEATDQTRGWFYTLLAVSTLLDKGAPYKNVICLGLINDKEGKKMSKTKGNVVDPWMIADKYGIDALRMHLFSINQPGDSKNFDEKDVEEVLRKVVMLTANVVNFYELYSREKNTEEKLNPAGILDRWIVAKTNQLIKDVTNDLENYHVFEASRGLIKFIDELSTWYVRRSRERLKTDSTDKEECLKTLNYAINNLICLLAPFTPFMTERIYQKINGRLESIHLEDWPKHHDKLIDKKLLLQMEKVRKVVELGLAARAEAGIKVRQPLGQLILNTEYADELKKIIAEELNVKEITETKNIKDIEGQKKWLVKTDNETSVALNTEISDELKAEGWIRELTRQINQLRKDSGLTLHDLVTLCVSTEDTALRAALNQYTEALTKGTLAKELKLEKTETDWQKETVIEGKAVWLGLKK